jgi:hypothetical protein
MLLHLACVVTGLGVYLAGALLFSSGHAAHTVCGGALFAMGAAGFGLQGWHAVSLTCFLMARSCSADPQRPGFLQPWPRPA